MTTGARRGEIALRRNNAHYEALLALLRRGGMKAETTLKLISRVATFSFLHHTGRFVDGAIENLALGIGADLDKYLRREVLACGNLAVQMSGRAGTRNVLHVASSVLPIAGHSRTIRNWIINDPDTRHSLLLTCQGWAQASVPRWLSEVVRDSGGEVVELPREAPLLTQARWAREIARAAADLVVLHHYPNDVVPIVAFATRECPPVALLNHADHAFWMGGTVSDAIINQRHIGKTLSEGRRFTRHNLVLPIPLAEIPPGLSRTVAREQLGIPRGQTMLLSVGRAAKYTPTRTHNFIHTAGEILERNPDAHIYLLGAAEDDLAGHLGAGAHERLHFLGPIEDATPYQCAADIYVEGFPFGSQTALLESALAGLPAVLAFDPPFALLATNDESLWDLASNPASEGEYIERAGALIRDPEGRRRLGGEFAHRVRSCHVGDEWRQRLGAIYERTIGMEHDPRPIPVTHCLATDTDSALSEWQMTSAGDDLHWWWQRAIHRGVFYILSRSDGLRRRDREVLRAIARRMRLPGC